MNRNILLSSVAIIALLSAFALAYSNENTEQGEEIVVEESDEQPKQYSQNSKTCEGGCGLNLEQCQKTSCGCGCR